ncbi:hypothetical protein ACJ41P_10630 [Azospirillum argentinense]|uniref:Tail length tape measure protein n=1 Tax=Azospirillum argentinense TaxID=2970906 RepID=A0ABW8V5Z3_9PROT
MTDQIASLTAKYDDQISAGAKAAADSLNKVAEAADYSEQRVTRAAKSGEQLSRQYDETARLAAKVDQITAKYSRDLESLEKSELGAAEKSKLRASILAQQEAAIQRATIANERYVAGLRALNASAASNDNFSRAMVTASAAQSAAMDKTAASAKRMNGFIQQAGYQVGDFASQISTGGNVAAAAGMQLGQLLQSLGPLGAAMGAIVNVGGVAIGMYQKSAQAAEEAAKATDLLTAAQRASLEITESSTERARRLREERNEQAAAAYRAAISERELADAMAMTAEITARSALDKTNRSNELYLAQGPGRFLGPVELDRLAYEQKTLEKAAQTASETRRALQESEQAYSTYQSKLASTGGFSGSELDDLRQKVDGIVASYDDATDRTVKLAEKKRDLDAAVSAGIKTQSEADDILSRYTKHLDENSAAAKEAEKAARDREKAEERLEKKILAAVKAADADAVREYNKTMSEGERVLEATRTPQERFAREQERLNGLLSKGAIDQETFNRAVQAADPAMQEAKRATEAFQREIQGTAKEMSRDITVALLDRESKWSDLGKTIGKRIALGLLEANIVLPITTAIVGGASGLFGIQSPANQNAANQNDPMGGYGQYIQAGQSAYNAATGTNTLGTAANSFATSEMGYGLGMSSKAVADGTGIAAGYVDTIGSTQIVNGTTLTSTGQAATSTLGAIGAAAPYGMLGGMAGSYIGNQAGGNKAVGGLSGAAIGVGSYAAGTAAMGAMGMGAAASAAGLSGMAGATAALSAIPVYGWIAAAVLAAVTAIAGTQKPSTQYAQAWARTDNTGAVVDRGSAAASSARGKVSALEQRAEGVASLIGTLTQAGGFDNRGIVLAAESDTKGNRYRIDGLAGPVVSRSESGTQVVLDVLRHMRDTGEFRSGYNGTLAGRTLDRAIGIGETDMEGFGKGLALARQVEAGTTALREFDKSLAGVTSRAKEAQVTALKPMTEELALASKYGFEGEYRSLVNGQLASMLEDLANPQKFTETQVEAATFTGQIAAMREELSKINPELAKTIDGIEKAGLDRIYKKVRDSFDAAMNTAIGNDYRNQLKGVRDYWNTNAFEMLGAGRDPNELYFAQAKQIIDGLSGSQIDDVVSYFKDLDPVMAMLADSLRDTTTAAKEAQKAVQANADSLTAWLNGQKLGDASSLSPWEKMQEAQRQFDAAVSAARQSGDISGATKAADSLLSASKPALVMGTEGYSQREAWITSTLKNLGHELGLPGFKTGGSFEVGGWGGVDSTLVRFMATPGERVTVTRPGQQPQGQTVVVRDNEDVVRALSQMVGVLSAKLDNVTAELSSLKDEKRKDTNLELMRKAS